MFTDRYAACGVPYQDPKTVCRGGCEGLGFYPTTCRTNPRWLRAHWRAVWRSLGIHLFKCDGWHFVECERCHGTGRVAGQPSVWGSRCVRGE